MKEMALFVKNYLEIFESVNGRQLGHGTLEQNIADLMLFATDFLLYDEDDTPQGNPAMGQK